MLMLSAAGLSMRAMVRMSGGALPHRLAAFLVDTANGRTLRGLRRLITG
jgi:hypothetical protein